MPLAQSGHHAAGRDLLESAVAPKLHCKMAPLTTWMGMRASPVEQALDCGAFCISRDLHSAIPASHRIFRFYWQTKDAMLTRRAYADLQWQVRAERGDPWRPASPVL